MNGNSNGESNFPYKLLLTNTEVSKPDEAFANAWSANIKLLKSQLYKIGQSRTLLERLFGPFLKTGLLLIENC